MSEPFLAEIRIVGFNFAPRGWALCDGQLLPINQNQSLYSLLGTNYGGDGRTTFGLPDLRGRTPIHVSGSYKLGAKGGAETVPLTIGEMPAHEHPVNATTAAASETIPAGELPPTAEVASYKAAGTLVAMSTNAVGNTGNDEGHENMQPYQVLNFCIALQGLFPSRN